MHHCFKKHSAERKGSVARSQKLFFITTSLLISDVRFTRPVHRALCSIRCAPSELHYSAPLRGPNFPMPYYSYPKKRSPTKRMYDMSNWHLTQKTQRQKTGLYLTFPHVTTWFQKFFYWHPWLRKTQCWLIFFQWVEATSCVRKLFETRTWYSNCPGEGRYLCPRYYKTQREYCFGGHDILLIEYFSALAGMYKSYQSWDGLPINCFLPDFRTINSTFPKHPKTCLPSLKLT